jgi:Tol biopolymer transport system component
MKIIWKSNITLLIILSTGLLAAKDPEPDESRFLTNTRELIYEGKRSGEGYFSPDGKNLIFQSERLDDNPFFQIYILDLETGESHRVSTGKGKTTCAFFRPGSDQVLFASTHLDPQARQKQEEEIEFRASGKERRYSWDYDVYMDIFTADRTGASVKRLTDSHGYDAEGAYSPDGSKIVFCSLRNAYSGKLSGEDSKRLEIDPSYFGEIYIMEADGSNQTRLTNSRGYDGGPFFSPDGNLIVWRHFDESGAIADVYTMAPDGSDVSQITDFKAMSWAPYFYPSGEYIVFASNILGFGNFEIYLVDAAGKRDPIQVTTTDGFDGLPVFSPDGKKLVWTSNRTGNKKSQLFMADWNHAAALTAISSAPMRATTAVGTETVAPVVGQVAAKDAIKMDPEKGAELSPQISAADLRQMVGYLASDKLEGRMSGSRGIKMAADYIIKQFEMTGLQPVNPDGGFRHEFEFTAGVKLTAGANHFEISRKDSTARIRLDEEFRPLAFSMDAEVEGEVVFAGYGLSVPGERGEGYDSYAGLDVKNKIVLALRDVPEDVSMERRQQLNRYAGLRYKAMIARENGAKAIIVFSGPGSPRSGDLVELGYDQSAATSGIAAVTVTREIGENLFAVSGMSLAEVQSELDRENPHFEAHFAIPDLKVKIRTGVERIRKPDNNLVAVLPGSGPEPREKIVVGAHYDHIGYGEIGSLAHKGEEGQIHNGADDNASGTATVLEVMSALALVHKEKPEAMQRDLVFALWSGEELGLIGSSDFVSEPPFPLEQMVAYVNFDMVGRLNENKLILQGTGSSSVWRKLIEKRNVSAGFDLTLQDDPFQPTDISAFYPKGVPVLAFFTGSHDDYNRPTDDAETLNYDGMERIAKFAKLLLTDLASLEERPDLVKIERTKSKQGGRESMRAYLGTIPDYANEASGGLALSGVSAGGPADQAGLKGGDIIVKLAGKEITNIYDYTYAIEALKIGEEVEIAVLRDGEELTLTIVPMARE